jgi:hypothetical protein
LCDGLIPLPRKKPIIQKEEEKTERINTMKTNSKRKKDLLLATWNVRTLYRTGGLRMTINELRRWTISTPQAFTINGYNKHEFGTAFFVVDWSTGRQMAIKSTYFMHKRIHLETWHWHCMIDGRHFSDVIDVKAQRGANLDSDHIVVIKLRYRISRASNTTPQQLRRFAVERLNDGNVATMYRHELEAELSGASEPEPLNLNDKWRQMEVAVRKVATNTIGYTRKQAGKEWFDEECEKVNEEKNACRANTIHRRTRAAKEIYRQARSKERDLFLKKTP